MKRKCFPAAQVIHNECALLLSLSWFILADNFMLISDVCRTSSNYPSVVLTEGREGEQFSSAYLIWRDLGWVTSYSCEKRRPSLAFSRSMWSAKAQTETGGCSRIPVGKKKWWTNSRDFYRLVLFCVAELWGLNTLRFIQFLGFWKMSKRTHMETTQSMREIEGKGESTKLLAPCYVLRLAAVM